MDWDKKLELLSSYLDGEVSAEERELAERLLRDDPEAAELYGNLSRTAGMLNGLEPLEAPLTLHQKVMMRVRPGEPTGFAARIRRIVQPRLAPIPVLTYAGAVVVIAVGLIYLMTFGLTQAPVTDQTPQFALQSGEPEESEGATAEKKRDTEKGERFALGADTDEAAAEESPPHEAEAESQARGEAGASGATAAAAQPAAPTEDYAALNARAERREAVSPTTGAARARTTAPDRITAEAGPIEPAYFTADQRDPGIPSAESEGEDPAEQFYVSETVTYITERGAPMELDPSAPEGSDANPISDPSTFLPPRFLTFEFLGRGTPQRNGEIQVFIESHIARDGSIIYMRIIGRRSNARLIEDLADRLYATRLVPARGEQDAVSVFYSFVAVIKPAG